MQKDWQKWLCKIIFVGQQMYDFLCFLTFSSHSEENFHIHFPFDILHLLNYLRVIEDSGSSLMLCWFNFLSYILLFIGLHLFQLAALIQFSWIGKHVFHFIVCIFCCCWCCVLWDSYSKTSSIQCLPQKCCQYLDFTSTKLQLQIYLYWENHGKKILTNHRLYIFSC